MKYADEWRKFEGQPMTPRSFRDMILLVLKEMREDPEGTSTLSGLCNCPLNVVVTQGCRCGGK